MKKSAHTSHSTQKFIGLTNIIEDVVLLESGNACLVIEIQATNFALLSRQEQDARLFAYAAFLNSLSFSIQILIRNKRIDISSYITRIKQELQKPQQNELLVSHINLYRDFIQELVKVNIVLDKKFYIVIPYSHLERGDTTSTLHSKAESIHAQLGRLSLRAKTLVAEELTKLFYDIYNPNQGLLDPNVFTSPIVTGGQP